MSDFIDSKYVKDMSQITQGAYKEGFDERNGGNLSLLIRKEEMKGFDNISQVKRSFVLGFNAQKLAGDYFLITKAGSYFRNIAHQPNIELALVQITANGKKANLLWGLDKGGAPTSEFPSHLMSHIERLKINSKHRVVMHSHPDNLVAMSITQPLDEYKMNRLLWRMEAESLPVLPEGIGIIPYMTPGTTRIGRATANKMKYFRAVMWPQHGMFASGADLDEAFGIVETVEKCASIFTKVCSQGGKIRQDISTYQLCQIASAFHVQPNLNFLPEYKTFGG